DNTGYILQADTNGSFTSPISSITYVVNASSLAFDFGTLAPNTTYFGRVGALYDGATTYAPTVPASTSTLTSLITTYQFYQVNVTSVVVNWAALGSADGYRLDAATDAGFTNIVQ